jgi:hypothetical protein
VLIDRQVTLLIANNKVVRAISVSSGKPSTPTPPGDYHVYAKIRNWWSTPFRECSPSRPVRRGHRLPPVRRGARVPRAPRLCPPVVHGRAVDLRLLGDRHAGQGGRTLVASMRAGRPEDDPPTTALP